MMMQALFGASQTALAARVAVIAAFAFATALAGIFTMPPLDRDESRFAQATAQMIESGDYISIRFQDEERNKKPAGIHWLQAAAVNAFSSVEAREIWAYRLPSLAGAVLAVVFTYAAGARLFGARAGFLAALMMAGAPILAAEATIAKTDAVLLACVAAAQTAMMSIYGSMTEGRGRRLAPAAAMWAAIGVGILIKGPVILLVVGATAVCLMLRKPHTAWIAGLYPLSGFLILSAMVAPWAIAISEATEGRFFADALGGDMAAKIVLAQESHAGPPGYHAVLLFALLWPAAMFIPAGVMRAISDRSNWRTWFAISWIAPSWIVFELTATKLPHYVLPLYPAIAMIAAEAAIGETARFRRARLAGIAAYVMVGLAISVTVALLAPFYKQDSLGVFCAASGAAIAAGCILSAAFTMSGRPFVGASAAALTSSLLAWALLAGILPRLDLLNVSPRVAAAFSTASAERPRAEEPPAILSGYYEPSAIFLLGTNTVLADGATAADRIMEDAGPAAVESREERRFLERLKALGGGAEKFSEVAGVNYSNGKEVRISLYRRAEAYADVQD